MSSRAPPSLPLRSLGDSTPPAETAPAEEVRWRRRRGEQADARPRRPGSGSPPGARSGSGPGRRPARRSPAGRPQASLPNSQAVGPASSGSRPASSLAGAVGGQHGEPGRRGRRPARRAAGRRGPPAGGTGEPALARTALPLYGSTLSPASTTASAPAASALRSTVPALPGSRMSASTATSRGRAGQRGRQRARRAPGRPRRGPAGWRSPTARPRPAAVTSETGTPAGVRALGQVRRAGRAAAAVTNSSRGGGSCAERLPDRLRSLGQELPGRVPAGPPGQLPRGGDPRRALGEQRSLTASPRRPRTHPAGGAGTDRGEPAPAGPATRCRGRRRRGARPRSPANGATPRRPRTGPARRRERRAARSGGGLGRPAAPPARCAPARRTRPGR